MRFAVIYDTRVVAEDISRLSAHDRKQIQTAIETKLTALPDIFGKPLRHSLKGYRKLRVGDYRVVFRIEICTVKIFCIGHRAVVYKLISRRI